MNAMAWMAWGGMAGIVGVYGRMWQKAGRRGRMWLEWGLAAVVAGVSLASVLTHEPWRDELHAWLQAREMGLGALWKEMAYEGHFIPWHLMLWPLAHSGAPVWTMGVVSWALNAMAVWWLARRSPLTGWEKAVAGTSCVFLYLNPVVSRCYALVPLALFGVASLWGKRDERPVAFGLWVALLANTHLYLEGVAVAVFVVFTWENVLRRKDGKGWRACGRQWAGLGAMALGGLLALVQVLPSLWKSSVVPGHPLALWQDTSWFFQVCVPWVGFAAAVGGVALLGVEAWRQDRSAFWVYAAGLCYMWGFSVFLYEASVPNRSVLWWPMVLATAWMLAGKGGGVPWKRLAAVAAAGLALFRPDATWGDWRRDFDPLPGACQWIAGRYGKDAEIWINGADFATEPAAAYLDNVVDWRTGEKVAPISWAAGKNVSLPFRTCAPAVFRTHPEKECFLALVSMWDFSGLEQADFTRPGAEIEKSWTWATGPGAVGLALMRVRRWGGEWVEWGVSRFLSGDGEGAEEAWKRAVEESPEQWKAMNNLAWFYAEAGRAEEARAWMDRAMENASARASAGAWDTAAAVCRAEGDEEGARDAERRRDELKTENAP